MTSGKEQRILKLLGKKAGKEFSESKILRELRMSERKRSSLNAVLSRLILKGLIKKTSRGKYRLGKNARNASGKPNSSNGFMNGESLGVLAELRKTTEGFVACPRKTEVSELRIENLGKKKVSEGELVVVDINRKTSSARIIERLGMSGELETEKRGIISEYRLPKSFSREITKEVGVFNGQFSNGALLKRVNLEKETIFTIDGDDAKDFDDAVGIKKVRRGYRLWVNIADVSYYVPCGGACDEEASRRATSTYLSDRVVPMLPKKLSNDLCSLRPKRKRLTKTVEMDFDSSGSLKNFKIYNSMIKSVARLTYSQVAAVLEKKSPTPLSGREDITASLFLMRELYEKLKKSRISNGGLDFNFPEAVLLRNSAGEIEDVGRFKRNEAHEIIEEFMIMANSAVAAFIFKNGFESIYRIHEPPDQDSIKELRESLRKLGLKTKVAARAKQSDIQAIMKAASERRDREQVHVMILRALKKAVYSTKHVPHFGLAIDDYTHFTSPIRRYPDLVVHRILDDILNKKDPSYNFASLNRIADHCSATERRAEDAERQFMNLETANFMKSRVGEVFHGKIVSIHPFGVFIELKEHFVEGLIPEHCYKQKGGKRKWFELGDEVRVKLISADTERRRLTFDLSS